MANATIRLGLTAIRLFYDHLIEEGLRGENPVGRGRYTQGGGFGGARPRALVPHFTALPWIPNDAEWRQLLQTARSEPLCNRVVLALAYDAGFRRQELCLLATGDIDPAHRLLFNDQRRRLQSHARAHFERIPSHDVAGHSRSGGRQRMAQRGTACPPTPFAPA